MTSLFLIPEAGTRMAIHPAIHPQAVSSFHLPSPKVIPACHKLCFPLSLPGELSLAPEALLP